MKTSEKIVQLLKALGPQTAKVLATELSLTTMGVRQHMQALEDEGDVRFEDIKASRGRPTRVWSLTSKSNSHFGDRHEELSVQLIDSVIAIFGDSGLDKLITHREEASLALYQHRLVRETTLLAKLTALAELREAEGYMASVIQEDGFYWLLENHCPICAAASQCLSFCRSELNLFQTLLDGVATVNRVEHIIEGARRCAYKVIPINQLIK
ncbi:transcriptional regulator [Shewanella sp. D64]|uniref:helix-turn-helix transcriptional regulator n=1 Tax=unclassified Shewanella TaxID=196818 RepID=UPI0022BA267A|nr:MULTISPECIES: metalloregulator ArsR/SmtB family transcription factor [unclassified Shewanella]MEC4727302.1 transcriptional regulator [Shewanella sp. D64]MEC4739457.1 transcriptional regulator [Shewanella sp. E94]WBJ96786.1 transcriptional regulator [Shewanella sp. MTB7]